ncbi:MAG: LCP family protein, partial [Selenomonadales bacterium]|nr:LCP family protein [Selenomonadales bacterium]
MCGGQIVENDMKYNKWQKNSKLFLLLIILMVVSVLAGCRFSLSDEPLKPVNVLVLGVDIREGDIGRSDTIFVMSLNREKNVATMLSIPRDSYVPIPGRGWDKINHAYAYGKGKLTRRTVENLLNIEIDYLVEVDRKGVEKMIDAIGGVEIDVEKRMYYEDPWDDDGGLVIDLEPGLQTLDGEEAVQYVRYRDKEGDIGRARRQQKFLAAAMDS